MVERLPLPAAVIVRLGRAGVNRDRARRGVCSRGSVQPLRSRRTRRLLEQARTAGAAGRDRMGSRRAVSYLLLRHPHTGTLVCPLGAVSRPRELP